MTYPTSIKLFDRKVNLQDLVVAEDINQAYDVIEEIERQLGAGGVSTSGVWGTSGAFSTATTSWTGLNTRLQNIENGVYFAHEQRVKTTGGSTITPSSSSVVGLNIKGASGQTANLLEVRNSSNAFALKVTATGVTGGIIDGGTA